MEKADRITVYEFEPGNITEKGNYNALVKHRKSPGKRKPGDNRIFQKDTHQKQLGCGKKDLIEKCLQGNGSVGKVFLYIDGR